MPAFLLPQATDAMRSRFRLVLSCVVPVVLLLAFLGKQFFLFDSLGWRDGFHHPLMGWDHLLTMLAVGVWAAQLRGHAIWILPMAFVGVMSIGGLAGAAGLNIPSVEGIILLSCAVFSLLITRRMRFSGKANVLIVAFFAFFHGFAHGHEISTSASLMSYTLGFMVATLLLHGAGILVAKLVILTIAFMFSAMFSASALAKATVSTAHKDSTLRMSPAMAPTIEARWTEIDLKQCVEGAGQLLSSPSMAEANNPVDGLGFLALDAQSSPDAAFQRGQGRAQLQRFNVDPRCSALERASRMILESESPMTWREDDANPLSWVFKRHFPQINHTPGTRFLSNGAGLTSPPLATCYYSLIPPVALSFSNTLIPDLGAHTLQSNRVPHRVDTRHPDFSLRIRPPISSLLISLTPARRAREQNVDVIRRQILKRHAHAVVDALKVSPALPFRGLMLPLSVSQAQVLTSSLLGTSDAMRWNARSAHHFFNHWLATQA